MSCGFLMYAYNNKSIDYTQIAVCNALLIKKHLKRNAVALVTSPGTHEWLRSQISKELHDRAFDHVIYQELVDERVMTRKFHDTRYSSFSEQYYNLNRTHAFDTTPFEQTILLDVDYLMLDGSMDLAWDSVEDFMCNRKTIDLDHKVNNFGDDNRLNEMSIPLYWATAMYFRKTEKSRLVFEMINFIKENYEYYQHLYGFKHSGYFRNDFALSIAIHMCNNFMEYGTIKPLPVDHILFSMENDDMHAFDRGHTIMTTEPSQGDFRLRRVINNLHVMNKRSILRHMKEIVAYATG